MDDDKLKSLAKSFANFPGPALDLTRTIELDLSGTNVTDVGVGYLRDLRIANLNLSNTEITDKSIDSIATLNDGRVYLLRIENTKVTDEGFARLEKLLQHGEIRR